MSTNPYSLVMMAKKTRTTLSCRQEIWPLIESGGYIYVCGEAKNMAKDVHKTLLKLAESQPGGTEVRHRTGVTI